MAGADTNPTGNNFGSMDFRSHLIKNLQALKQIDAAEAMHNRVDTAQAARGGVPQLQAVPQPQAASIQPDAFSGGAEASMARLRTPVAGSEQPPAADEHHSSRMVRDDGGRFVGYPQ